MIRINLLPVREIKAEVTRKRDLAIAGITLGVTALVLAGIYLYQGRRVATMQGELEALRREIQALNLKVKEVGELQVKIKEFQAKHQVIEDLNRQKVGPVRVMESLSAAVPPTLWLTEFKETGGKVTINGLAVDNQSVADFMRNLSKLPYFSDVELVETLAADAKTGPYKKFAISAKVSYRARPPERAETKSVPAVKDGKP
ncbi:MAG TPA: PilN domain-containing protein [candidate division Zixibacteria bacterium]|nr:PilN domain-containing protein [candidate division Zixibacteria bacterium]